MKSQISVLIPLLAIIQIVCLDNLVTDQGFQTLSSNLLQTYSGIQPYNYRQMPNTQSKWYSTTSSYITIRAYTNPQTMRTTTVMDTLDNNTHNIICHNFDGDYFGQYHPYQLSFDYMLDGNVNRPVLNVTWNYQEIMFRRVRNRYIITVTYTIYMQQGTNKLCFQAYGEHQAEMIGALIDNVVVAKQDVRFVYFFARPLRDMVNYLQLVSNQTVQDDYQLSIFQQQSILNISQTQFSLQTITTNQNNYLTFHIQILQQYSSSTTITSIYLPVHRNKNNQLIYYYITGSKLPYFIYTNLQTEQLMTDLHQPIILINKIQNICYRIIRIIGFSYIGINWIGFYYVGLMVGFFDVWLVDGAVRREMEIMMKGTINGFGVKYFVDILGFTPYTFGQQYINLQQNLPQPQILAPSYSKFDITTSIYPLLYDNLLISIFNTIKIILLYKLIYKNSPKMHNILKPIKSNKILIQYIIIIPLIVLIATNCWINSSALTNIFGKINRILMIIMPMIGIILSITILVSQWKQVQNNCKKLYNSKNNKKIKKYRKYSLCNILLNFNQCIKIIIIPGFIGLNLVYPTLIILLISAIISLSLKFTMLHLQPSFINFISFIIKIIHLFLPLCFMLPHIVYSIANMGQQTQISIINILRYNSIVLLFVYIIGGSLQICISIFQFFKGCTMIQCKFTTCKSQNQVQNKNQIQGQEDNSIKIDKQISQQYNKQQIQGIIIINQLKNKIQKKKTVTIAKQVISSSGEITNPFVSTKKVQQKQQTKIVIKQPTKEYKQKQVKMVKVITMKNIQPLKLEIEDIQRRIRHKSSDQINYNQNIKQTPIKKAREVSGNKQKSLKFIDKIDLTDVYNFDQKQNIDTQQIANNMVVSSFEKQQNFS